jgi:hypothetical protein
MDEFSVNRLSVMLDVDRQTLVRALKDIPADAGTERKPLFRVLTAIDALDQHRARPDRRRKQDNGGNVDVELQRMFIRLEDLRDKIEGDYVAGDMVAIESTEIIEGRRRLMREEFFPLLFATTLAMYKDSKRSGEDRDYGGLRIAEHERVQLVTMRHCCGWNSDEALTEYLAATATEDEDA